jgi:hypothetical protein
MGRVLVLSARARKRRLGGLVASLLTLIALTSCASEETEPNKVSEIRDRGVESERALEICRGWWGDVSEQSEFVTAVDSTIEEIANLEADLKYPDDDLNLEVHPPNAYVALCLIGGEAAHLIDGSDYILMYFLEDPQDNAIIWISGP